MQYTRVLASYLGGDFASVSSSTEKFSSNERVFASADCRNNVNDNFVIVFTLSILQKDFNEKIPYQ